jgi:hypothetical protein
MTRHQWFGFAVRWVIIAFMAQLAARITVVDYLLFTATKPVRSVTVPFVGGWSIEYDEGYPR